MIEKKHQIRWDLDNDFRYITYKFDQEYKKLHRLILDLKSEYGGLRSPIIQDDMVDYGWIKKSDLTNEEIKKTTEDLIAYRRKLQELVDELQDYRIKLESEK